MGAAPPQPDAREALIAELSARNAQLEARVVQLEAKIRKLEALLTASDRSAKRQAAPFSKGLPGADPKTPGRKPGEDYGTIARPDPR